MLAVNYFLFRPVPLQKIDGEGGRAWNPHFHRAAFLFHSEKSSFLYSLFLPSSKPLLFCRYASLLLFSSLSKRSPLLLSQSLLSWCLENEQGDLFCISLWPDNPPLLRLSTSASVKPSSSLSSSPLTNSDKENVASSPLLEEEKMNHPLS